MSEEELKNIDKAKEFISNVVFDAYSKGYDSGYHKGSSKWGTIMLVVGICIGYFIN